MIWIHCTMNWANLYNNINFKESEKKTKFNKIEKLKIKRKNWKWFWRFNGFTYLRVFFFLSCCILWFMVIFWFRFLLIFTDKFFHSSLNVLRWFFPWFLCVCVCVYEFKQCANFINCIVMMTRIGFCLGSHILKLNILFLTSMLQAWLKMSVSLFFVLFALIFVCSFWFE